jgi:LysM repeat protein
LWPLFAALAVGVVASAALAMTRVKVENNETVEAIAQRVYRDMTKAAVLRAANKIEDGAQPANGAMLKTPGDTTHTVSAGETLQKVADRFLSAENGAALLAEVNNLTANAALKPGQVLTIFAEIEVRTSNRSAEELASVYLGNATLGARIRRYNGVADGAKLPGKVYLPLVGLRPGEAAGPVAVAPPYPRPPRPRSPRLRRPCPRRPRPLRLHRRSRCVRRHRPPHCRRLRPWLLPHR